MSHGFISTEAEADWKGRRTRECRLTFVNTTPRGRHKPATNEYRDWAKKKQKAVATLSPLTPTNGDALSPHIATIPLSEKKEEQSASELGYTQDKDGNGPLDFDAAIHAQIAKGWNALSSQAKTTLAQRHGVSALGINSYLRGEQQFSPAKLMAIRSDLSSR
jgi:hypothetical protein